MANEDGTASRGLELSTVSVRRGARLVLDQMSLRLVRGEILVVVGPNGAGKTTLLETVLGAVPSLRSEDTKKEPVCRGRKRSTRGGMPARAARPRCLGHE